MKHFSWIIGLLLLCSTQVSYAQNCNTCDPCMTECSLCDINCCDMSYDFYVDYLYWKVNRADLNFDEEPTNFIDPDFDHGFRVGGNLRCDCWNFGVRYTYYQTDESKDDNDYDLKFRTLDVEGGYTFHICGTPMDLTPFAGVKFAWIDEDREIDDNDIDLDFYGVGLYLGLGSKWSLCNWNACNCCIPISLVARASTGIMDGEFDADSDDDCDGDRKDECLFVPVHEMYIGLDFRFCDLVCDTDVNLQIGYEAQYWGYREFSSNDDISNLGLGGLVVRLGATF